MKIITLILATLVTTTASASDQDYHFNTMECIGKLRQIPKGVSSYYAYKGLRIIQFKTKKNDGSYVDSMGWNIFTGKTRKDVLAKMAAKKRGEEVWYTGLFSTRIFNGKKYILSNDQYINRFVGVVPLKSGNNTQEYFKARYGRKSSVLGNYFYDFMCSVKR